MFYPFPNKCELKLDEPPPYCTKTKEAGVIEVRNEYKILLEPFSDLVDDAFFHYRSDVSPSWYLSDQQENDEVN